MRNLLFLGTAALMSASLIADDSTYHQNFNTAKTKQVSRYSSQVVAAEGEMSNFYTRGQVQFIAGKEGYALDLSEGKGRSEGRLRVGQKFYDANVATFGFWLKATEDSFGVKDKEAVIVEERGSEAFLSLVVDKFGRFSLRGATTFVDELPAVEEIVEEKRQNFQEDLKEQEAIYRKRYNIVNDRPLSDSEKVEVEKGLYERYAVESAKELAEMKKTGLYKSQSFDFLCDKKMNVDAFKEGAWNHVAISWNSFLGTYVVLFNGEVMMITKNSVALRDGFRRNSGEFITFSPGKSGLKMAIDNVKIKSYVIDGDIKVSKF
ncbi:hypothetical protein LNTAR_15472 [Lentisphaera araneosa HTCC2155]|jgi:hypothetical protein|uniref:Uncharacterized protein n=1 Tax=Lentisphaera araneosa HTCC2155 TaxID=313628 RepID=A6DM92_9BACT|nr:hypothetical protein [Lentisphaera araneosa]EDM27082.1 hypothetical protein LNTAR_15472 [Lentisphaera araneosa HTCC2155]